MQRVISICTEALENTHKIAERCNVEIEFGVTKLPKFDVPEGYTSWEYLNKLCFEGLERTLSGRGIERASGIMNCRTIKNPWDMLITF